MTLLDSAASLAIQEGASVIAVARLLGHESAATTLKPLQPLRGSVSDQIWTTSLPDSTPVFASSGRCFGR
jgi:integrase